MSTKKRKGNRVSKRKNGLRELMRTRLRPERLSTRQREKESLTKALRESKNQRGEQAFSNARRMALEELKKR